MISGNTSRNISKKIGKKIIKKSSEIANEITSEKTGEIISEKPGHYISRIVTKISENKARRWAWIGLAVFVALQIYFIQQMLVLLLLFTAVFVAVAVVALVLYLVDSAGQWSVDWAEQHSGPVVRLARRAWTLIGELSKKLPHRPRSEPVQ